MLIPHHLNPLSREKNIQGINPPMYLGYWLPLAITPPKKKKKKKKKKNPVFLRKSSRDYGQKLPPFPRKQERS